MFAALSKFYRHAFLAVVVGLLISGLAFLVMGTNFGFENVSVVAVVPGFIVGVLLAVSVMWVNARGRGQLRMRIEAEQRLSAELQAENRKGTQAEDFMRAAQESYRLVTDSVPTGIIVHSSGTVVFANPAAVKMFGAASEHDMLGMDALDLVNKAGRKDVLSNRAERVGQEDYAGFLRLQHKRLDGSLFWSEGHAREFVYDGHPSTLVMIQDITEQVATEGALEESRERFQNFAEASADWFWEIDADLRITFISESVERIMGIPAAWFIGQSRPDLADTAADREQWAQHVADLEARRPFRDFEYLRRGDGEVRTCWVRSSGVPVFGEDGQFLGYVGSASDVTEYKQAEERLRISEEKLAQAQKLETVGQLTGGIAHDFNNLLAVIQGNAEILGDGPDTDNAPVQTILRAAKRGAELTQRLLAYSRRQSLQPQAIDLSQLVVGLTDLLARTLGATIEVETHIPADIAPIMADPGQLENALLNLSINARDAMRHGGKLIIACSSVSLDDSEESPKPELDSGDYVVLAVSDTGHGMSASVTEQAFEPFFTTKDVGEGSGLGLSMVYGFARQSGGDASIYSEEGRGTTVKIYLPVATSMVQATPPGRRDEVPQGNGEMILVIEDDTDVRALAVRILQSLGYKTFEVPDAVGAETLLANGVKPDLVLSDVVLPGGTSGPQFAEAARARDPDINILFMSGYPDEAARQNGFLGSDSVLLNKPFQRRQLAQAVHDALG